ncbi:hypothetical protein PIB30_026042 [Stylosanthes scabra]|uniref:Transmembrane protein n=1 Tax=Stylosanthes scabra TaxID=79078 RepID=A0ABU6XBZ1_9FABA|nr:hypothetical protein [Stylosanthes scabra]
MASCSASCFFSASATSSSNQVAFCRKIKLLSQSPYPKIRFQCFKDNGKPANIVDANLSVLRGRIQEMRKRERDSNMHRYGGWNYSKQSNDDDDDVVTKYKRESSKMVTECAEMLGMACGAIGLVFFIGSIGICLVSLLVYICKNEI